MEREPIRSNGAFSRPLGPWGEFSTKTTPRHRIINRDSARIRRMNHRIMVACRSRALPWCEKRMGWECYRFTRAFWGRKSWWNRPFWRSSALGLNV